MSFTLFIPLFLGAIGILQGALNKNVSTELGLAHMSLFSNFMTFIICVVFFLTVKFGAHHYPEIFHTKTSLFTFKWWYIFPPLFGFFIVTGLPWAIAELGTIRVTVGLIAAQMIASVAWDLWVEGIPFNRYKFFGILFAALSVLFITIDKTKTS